MNWDNGVNWVTAETEYDLDLYAGDPNDLTEFTPMCFSCFWHKWGFSHYVCRAFPKGIPPDIWKGDIFHDFAIEGDNGYRFSYNEDIPGMEELKKKYPIKRYTDAE